ncbi:MAG TPA: hypothetical protein VMW22_08710 [Candidatus Desulfaltia sp.]|nr:hypothetical protein [Candidatus Desulfaltia sp.]
MSTESDTKKLLEYRETMEARLAELEQEIIDVRRAMAIIDKMIVAEGFRTPTASPKKAAAVKSPEINPQDEPTPKEGETTSITSKDGVVLGKLRVEGRNLVFRPQPELGFTVDIPPFKSFLMDRVLANMRTTDHERAANGELDAEEALGYEVKEEEGRILEITVTNYGGERRLREINSSLRWSFDKMYDKLRQG